jgi:hypothetical protein
MRTTSPSLLEGGTPSPLWVYPALGEATTAATERRPPLRPLRRSLGVGGDAGTP